MSHQKLPTCSVAWVSLWCASWQCYLERFPAVKAPEGGPGSWTQLRHRNIWINQVDQVPQPPVCLRHLYYVPLHKVQEACEDGACVSCWVVLRNKLRALCACCCWFLGQLVPLAKVFELQTLWFSFIYTLCHLDTFNKSRLAQTLRDFFHSLKRHIFIGIPAIQLISCLLCIMLPKKWIG